MTRVGLYLSLPPTAGGAYQYSLTMLEAVAALPRNRYSPVAVCARGGWQEIAGRCAVDVVDARPSLPSTIAAYGWRKTGLSIDIWRAAASSIDPHFLRLRRMSVDLWICPGQDPVAYLLPQPALVSVHDLMHRYEPQFPEVSGYRMRELHYKAICRYATGVLVDSETGKRQIIESYGIDAKKVHPLPYIPAPYMYRDDAADFAARYALPPKFFFYPAQFWEHKNHVRLLQAAASLSNEHPDIELVFVGSRKNGYDKVTRAVRELNLSGRVRFFDYVANEDMPAFYRRACALVMPTFFGPTNIPPLEAMVVGCPIAISGTYGMREQSGEAALYFDPRSVDEIAGCMKRLWSDDALRRQLSIRGRERSTQFSQARFNDRLRWIVDAVCDRS